MKNSALTNANKLISDIFFLFGSTLFILISFAVLRASLIIRNNDLISEIPNAELINAFLIGIRFDLIITSYILIPLAIGLLLPNGLSKRIIASLWLKFTFAICLFLGVVELDFYYEFHNRLNSIAFQYLKEDFTTVSNMIWNGFPVIRYLFLWLFFVVIFWYGIKIISVLTSSAESMPANFDSKPAHFVTRLSATLLILFILIIGSRGGHNKIWTTITLGRCFP